MPPLPHHSEDLNAPFDPSFGISPFAIEKQPQSLLPSARLKSSLSQSSSSPVGAKPQPQPQPSKPKKHEYRSLSVNEALQYSPLTSVAPLDTNCIGLPTSNFTPKQTIFENAKEKSRSQKCVNLLDKKLEEGESDNQAKSVLDTVKGLLQSTIDKSPELIFNPIENKSSDSKRSGTAKNADLKGLSAFSKMVFNSVKASYRYPTPEEISQSPKRTKTKPSANTSPVTPKTPVTPKHIKKNKAAYERNSKVASSSVEGPYPTTPSLSATATPDGITNGPQNHTPISPGHRFVKPEIVISGGRLSNDVSQYKVYNEETAAAKSSKRKFEELEDKDGEEEILGRRAESDVALENLLKELSYIFEVEESLRLNDAQATSNNDLIALTDPDGEERLMLSHGYQLRLDSLLHKVISFKRIRDVPLEDLVHIQKLCEGALIGVDGLEVAIQDGWGEDDISSWLERIESADTSLRSARTILRTMMGGRNDKELYSEELLASVIRLLSKVTDTCVVPIVESRRSDGDGNVFNIALRNKKALSQLLHNAGKIMLLFTDLLAREELAEQAVTELEFFVIRLLFVESSTNEKESVLGTARFESYRRTAMNVLATIFSKYPEQRQFIVNEILTSLQKLPTAKAQARQFRLEDNTRLQLVSVLLMRLVQTSGVRIAPRLNIEQGMNATTNGIVEEEDEGGAESESGTVNSEGDDEKADGNSVPPPLLRNVRSLYESTLKTAAQITNFLVTRASTASKTGDSPHRPLLDMFVQDLITVLPLPEWPAAELLLRALVSKLNEILSSDKSPVIAKTMALETMGMMNSAILDITETGRALMAGLESGDSNVDEQLVQHFSEQTDNHLHFIDLLSWRGPYRIVLEYQEANNADPQSHSVKAFYLMQWSKVALWGLQPPKESVDKTILGSSSLALRLCNLAYNAKWSSDEDFEPVSQSQCRLAYVLILLNIGVCRSFGNILNILVQSCSSDQIRVRMAGLRSITQMLEKDPLLIDRKPQIKAIMFKAMTDSSTNVRDNALSLVSASIEAKPALETELLGPILSCAKDEAVSIRKRAIKTLRDIYLRHTVEDGAAASGVRGIAAEGLLQRVQDDDEGTADLAKQVLEEAWLQPFLSYVQHDPIPVQDMVALRGQVVTMVLTMQRDAQKDAKLGPALETFLKFAMGAKSKNSQQNIKVCKAFVAIGFDGIVDATELPGQPEPQSILQLLNSFAEASPKLFQPHQLTTLQPYLRDLSSKDDLLLFTWVNKIFKAVLPALPSIQKDFLKSVQEDLFKHVQKLTPRELNEAAACLWTINGVFPIIDRLTNLEIGVLQKLRSQAGTKIPIDPPAGQEAQVKKLKLTIQRLIYLAGYFGRHCNFQDQFSKFNENLKGLSGDLVAGMVVRTIMPFARPDLPMDLRSVAVEGIGMVCQAWPRVYAPKDIAQVFQSILRGRDINLQNIVLQSFRDFLFTFEQNRQQFTTGPISGEKDPLSGGKLGGSMTANDSDNAGYLISGDYLSDVLRIALNSQDERTLTATEVIACVTRQGMTHPRECGPALVALETSSNPKIAQIAFEHHFKLHQQHESYFEREYMRAVQTAFDYQRNVAHDTRGFALPGYKAKLHAMYEVVKTGKAKFQAKFLQSYTQKIDFDVTKLEVSADIPPHLEYARFLIENLALFEFGRLEDAINALTYMERIVSGTGAGISHSINTEIFQLAIDPETGAPINHMDGEEKVIDVPAERLKLLTTASMILTMLWEARTFVRKLWGISVKDIRSEGKNKGPRESKAPTKSNAVTPEQLSSNIDQIWQSLDSRDSSLAQCKRFTDMLAIDSELKVAADSGAEELDGYNTPTGEDDGDSMVPASGGSRVKRRGSASLSSTPAKKRGRPTGTKNKKKGIGAEADDFDDY